ncbi:hypothetical protein C9374_002207 [Naegleria lovaniensis]|uniref:Uncharacterized protein n=1 Tax=Naegleria lovaniensis TaxID=51637 RepID=A0AA88GUC5_NAELO|nr:uncharacterized protein C9374_002207 [Naegleria lovaniensis]KAG2386463.1 hypothetical protein C9374_002207 [Naegleria lovaniensis]
MGSRFSKKSKVQPESRTASRFYSLRELGHGTDKTEGDVPNTARVRSKSNGWTDDQEQHQTSSKTSVHTSSFSSASSFTTASSSASSSNMKVLNQKVGRGTSFNSLPQTVETSSSGLNNNTATSSTSGSDLMVVPSRKHSSSPDIHSIKAQPTSNTIPTSHSDIGVIPSRRPRHFQSKSSPQTTCTNLPQSSNSITNKVTSTDEEQHLNTQYAPTAASSKTLESSANPTVLESNKDNPPSSGDLEVAYLSNKPISSVVSTSSSSEVEQAISSGAELHISETSSTPMRHLNNDQAAGENIVLQGRPNDTLRPGVDEHAHEERDRRRLSNKGAVASNGPQTKVSASKIESHKRQGEQFDIASLFSPKVNHDIPASPWARQSSHTTSLNEDQRGKTCVNTNSKSTNASISNNALQYQKNWFDSIFCRVETSPTANADRSQWDTQSTFSTTSSTKSRKSSNEMDKRRVSFGTTTTITCLESDETSSISSYSSNNSKTLSSRPSSSHESSNVPLIAISRADLHHDQSLSTTSRSINEERRKRVQEKLKQRTTISPHQHFESVRFHRNNPSCYQPHHRTTNKTGYSTFSPSSSSHRYTLSVSSSSSTDGYHRSGQTRETSGFDQRVK